MKTLIIGGTGNVGSLVTQGLAAKGIATRVMTRGTPKNPVQNVEYVQGDLSSGANLDTCFAGCDAVFMLNPVSMTETHEGIIGTHFAKKNGAKKFVYMGVHNASQAPHIPHFGSKVAIEAAIKTTGMSYTFLQPNNFYQNDMWLKDSITNGVYAQPIGDVGLHRVDVRDIADAAINALTSTGFENKAYVLCGPTLVNGSACAEHYAKALGKKVTYAGNDLDTWSKHMSAMLPAFMVQDFRIMYEHFQKAGLKATDAELKACESIVGHPLRTFDAFVKELTQSWK